MLNCRACFVHGVAVRFSDPSISNALCHLCLDDAIEIHGIVIQMQIGLKYCYLSTEVKDGFNKTKFNRALHNQTFS